MFRILVTFTRFVVGLRAWKLCITIKTCYFLLSHRCYNRFEALRGFASPRIVLHGLSAPLSASQRLSIPLNSSQRFSAPLNASQRLSAPLSTSHNKKTMCFIVSRPSPHPRPEREKCECHSDSQYRLPKVLYCRRLRFGFDDRHSTCGGTMSESM